VGSEGNDEVVNRTRGVVRRQNYRPVLPVVVVGRSVRTVLTGLGGGDITNGCLLRHYLLRNILIPYCNPKTGKKEPRGVGE
jgi:hypothetical protein